MAVKITVDLPACVGSGQCVSAAPAVFDQDDDGIAVLLQEEPAPEHFEDVRDAVLVCPAAAIHLTGSR
jgi:ferredoxin